MPKPKQDILPDPGEIIPVGSTNVDNISYDEETKELIVTFVKTGPYLYEGVDPGTVRGLLKAKSVGRFVRSNIAYRYPYRKL